jgi:hypothetical protein
MTFTAIILGHVGMNFDRNRVMNCGLQVASHRVQRVKNLVATLALLGILVGAGCGKNPPKENVTLRQLAVQYGKYVSQNEGMGPPGPKEFKDFIKQNATVPVEDVENLFISPRDKQPYVVYYNLQLSVPNSKGGPAIAHEQVGVNGKRLVALMTTRVEEADEDRFNELVSKNP